VSPFDGISVPRGIVRKGLWRIRSSSKLPLAPWPFFIKVPPPEFRHGMSSLGFITSFTRRFNFTQSSIDGAVVGRAVLCIGCRYQYWSRRWPGGQETGKTGLRHGRFSMRLAWFLAFCRRRLVGVILAGELAFAGAGCHQYYYYGDACPPGAPVPSTVRSGPVCDVPVEVVEGGPKLADGSSRSTTVSGAVSTNSSRVVVSEPSEPTKVAWKRSDPDGSPTTTSVQGTVNDSSPVNR
jgi:hypothetical protein